MGLQLLEYRGRAAAEAVGISEESAGILQNGLKQQVIQLLDSAKSRNDPRRATADANREPECDGTRRLPSVAPQKLQPAKAKRRTQSTIPSNGVVTTFIAATAMWRSQHAFHECQKSPGPTKTEMKVVILLSTGNFGIGKIFFA